MNNKPTLILMPNRAELDKVLSEQIYAGLSLAIKQDGYASLAVSGGRTPAAMLTMLGSKALDWEKLQTLLVDERWLRPDHEQSNEKMLRDSLLSGGASQSQYIPLVNDCANADDGQHQTEILLDTLNWPLTIVHLGMGNDGHTASWFHDAPEYPNIMHAHEQHCIAIHPGAAPYTRISLTPAAVFNSNKIVIQLYGKAKRDILESALARDADYPISLVLHQQQVPVEIYWAP
jgi:6-phosphogluconolactonase